MRRNVSINIAVLDNKLMVIARASCLYVMQKETNIKRLNKYIIKK